MKYGIKLAGLSAILSAMLLGSWSVAQAVPLYFQVSGHIDGSSIRDPDGIMQEMGLSAGDRVSLTFLIDLGSDADTADIDNPLHGTFDIALIYSSLYGPAPIADGALYPEAPWGGSGGIQVGDLHSDFIPSSTDFFGYAPNHRVGIYNYDPRFPLGTISELQPGDRFSYEEYVGLYDEDGDAAAWFHMEDHFCVDSVSTERPASSVPEPSVIWLFGVGMLGMAIRRLK
jgi:hypothetical protein